MKKAITLWVENDVEADAFCGTLMLKHAENMAKKLRCRWRADV